MPPIMCAPPPPVIPSSLTHSALFSQRKGHAAHHGAAACVQAGTGAGGGVQGIRGGKGRGVLGGKREGRREKDGSLGMACGQSMSRPPCPLHIFSPSNPLPLPTFKPTADSALQTHCPFAVRRAWWPRPARAATRRATCASCSTTTTPRSGRPTRPCGSRRRPSRRRRRLRGSGAEWWETGRLRSTLRGARRGFTSTLPWTTIWGRRLPETMTWKLSRLLLLLPGMTPWTWMTCSSAWRQPRWRGGPRSPPWVGVRPPAWPLRLLPSSALRRSRAWLRRRALSRPAGPR